MKGAQHIEVAIVKIPSDTINYLAQLIYHWIELNSRPQKSQHGLMILSLGINIF